MSTLEPKAAAIASKFWQTRSLVLVAEPGAGKTTVLPRALMEAQNAPPGQIWVLEPRRLAARMAATYVAQTLGTPVGQTVGYRIRFEDVTTKDTRVVYMTDGILARHLAHNPRLPGVACVLFDEFHERTLAQDVGLAALCALRERHGLQLALGAMSATLDPGPVGELLGGTATTFVAGRTFPVEVTYLPQRVVEPWPRAIARALGAALEAPLDGLDQQKGNVLVFLPGAQAIHAAIAACTAVAARHRARCLPLYAALSPAEQAAPFATDAGRTVVFATNVAETSLTLPGVRTVIDTGVAKQARQLPLSGITELVEGPISQASAIQRAGRAGRVAPGRCLRLYTLADFRRRPAFDVPEVARLDAAPALLFLAHLGLTPLHDVPLVDPVTPAAAAAAEALLRQLGAMDAAGSITALGHRLAQLPLHPRLARVVVEAERLGIAQLGCEAAAVLSEDVAPPPHQRREATGVADSDLDKLLKLLRHAPQAKRVAQNLQRSLEASRPRAANARPTPQAGPGGDPQARLSRALLAGFGDRVAKRLPPLGVRPGELPLAMARGGRAVLAGHSEVRDSPFVLALKAEGRGRTDPSGRPRQDGAGLRVSCALGLSADELMEAPGGLVQMVTERSFDAGRGRVLLTEKIDYDGLTLVEDTRVETHVAHAAPLLAAAFWRTHGKHPDLLARLAALTVRLRLAATWAPDKVTLAPNDAEATVRAALDAALLGWAETGQSLNKLDPAELWPAALALLPDPVQHALRRLVPNEVTLGHGRKLVVHYTEDAPPFVASYLQDFFGAGQSPTLADGRLALTVHLWGPNKRALQVTQDLASFWREHYPKLRPALARKYPRHAWPEDPLHAQPQSRPRRR